MDKTTRNETAASGKAAQRLMIFVRICLYLAVLVIGMRLILPRLVFHPMAEVDYTPEAYGMPFEDIFITTSDGIALNGWFVPAENERGTLLFFHGNAGNISHRLDSIEIFRNLGLSVFIIGYRGYGKSGGRPSIPGVTLDALAAWKYLTEDRGISPDKIVVFGRSLGGAVAMELTRHVKPGALILESTFSSLTEMIKAPLLVPVLRLLVGDIWNSAKGAALLTIPTLCLHSPDDEIVPYSFGRRIYENAASEKTFVELRGDHNEGFLESTDVYIPALDKFITDNFGEKTPQSAIIEISDSKY